MMKWKNFLILLGAVLILVLIVVGRPYFCPLLPLTETPGVQTEPVEAQPETPGLEIGPQVGKMAPDFTLLSLDEQNVSLGDFRGKPVLLTFGATWCPPCRAQKSHLITAYSDFADQGLVILGVNIKEDRAHVKEYALQKGIPFPVLLDANGEVAHLYQVRWFPTTFLIDRQGIVQETRVGAFRNAADVATSIRKIINAQP